MFARQLRPFAIAALTMAAVACSSAPKAPQTVDIKSADSVMLKATVFPAAKRGPAVLLLHQCDEQRKVWDSLGVKLSRAGITTLTVDYRGYGESGGIPHAKQSPAELEKMMTSQWPADIDSAYAYLLRQENVDSTRIGIGGGSCGVENALQLARRKSNAKALVLLAGGANHDSRAYIEAPNAPPVFVGAAADDQYADFVGIMGWLVALSPNKQSRSINYADGGHAAVVFNKHPQFADSIAKWFSAVLYEKPDSLPATNGKRMDAGVVAILSEMDRPGGAATVMQKLVAARKTNPTAQLWPEYYPNQLGYDHVQAKDFAGAIEIMKLNTVAYPDSPNAMDGLGDVYLSAGDTKRSLEASQRALVLLKSDSTDTPQRKQDIRTSAEAKIKQLSGK